MQGDGPTGQSVLVTGGAGFIGSHLAEALIPDNDVTVLDDLSSGSRQAVPDEATFAHADVREESVLAAQLESTDLVFHQAANASVSQSVKNPIASHENNVDATLQLLEGARREDVRVVLASSCAIYGHPETVPIPESEPTNPTSPYGLEKLTVDHYARLYHELYGLETVVLRYFNVYGPRQSGGNYSGVIDVFLDQATGGGPLTVHGDGTQTRDFVYVSDVVRANLAAAVTDQVGEAFNIGTGRSISIRELAELVRDSVETTVEIVHTDSRPGDVELSEADVSKATNQLQFEPMVRIADGLDRVTGWYQSEERTER